MKHEDFTDTTSGLLIKTLEGYTAFVPNPLPPKLELSWPLVERLSHAQRALSELAGVARTLPNPHLLIGPFTRREAVLSSRIEGTVTGLSDLFFFEAGGEVGEAQSDAIEVANYVKALDFGLARLQKLPVSLRLIREIHEQLMTGVRGENKMPGEFRQAQNWIGPPGCSLQDATYVPPPVAQMQEALAELEKYYHAESELPVLIRLALTHYQFEAIHPFLDGNGRVGRLLITLLLCSYGLLPQPLLYLSAFFERHQQDYYRGLLAVSQHGDWLNWITFFLRGIEEQAQDAVQRSSQLLALWQRYRTQLQSARASALVLRLIDSLIAMPVITYRRAEHLLQVTPRAAIQNVGKLVEAGILKEISGRQRGQIFIAPEIITLLESEKVGS
jgi:Fic family protein